MRTPETPSNRKRRNDQYTHAHGQIAMNHFYPRFEYRHRPSRHQGLCRANIVMGKKGIGFAIAARPVGTAKTGIGQSRESTENNQIKGEKYGDPRQLFVAIGTARQINNRRGYQRHQQRFEGKSDQHGIILCEKP